MFMSGVQSVAVASPSAGLMPRCLAAHQLWCAHLAVTALEVTPMPFWHPPAQLQGCGVVLATQSMVEVSDPAERLGKCRAIFTSCTEHLLWAVLHVTYTAHSGTHAMIATTIGWLSLWWASSRQLHSAAARPWTPCLCCVGDNASGRAEALCRRACTIITPSHEDGLDGLEIS